MLNACYHFLICSCSPPVSYIDSGKCVSADQWQLCTREPTAQNLYDTFVNVVSDPDDNLVTCGMHCFGLRDIVLLDPTVVTRPALPVFATRIVALDADTAAASMFTLGSMPSLKVSRVPCEMYPKDSLYFNPFGLYVLDSVENERMLETSISQ